MIQFDNLQQDKREMLIFMALKTKESLYSDLYQQSITVIYLCTYKEKKQTFLKGSSTVRVNDDCAAIIYSSIKYPALIKISGTSFISFKLY